jgi:hypothetical protein
MKIPSQMKISITVTRREEGREYTLVQCLLVPPLLLDLFVRGGHWEAVD